MMQLRHAMEKADADVRYLIKVTRQAYVSFFLAVASLLGSLILGPLGLIPTATAWGVGICGTVAFGVVSGVQFEFLANKSITEKRHAYELAQKRYYDALLP